MGKLYIVPDKLHIDECLKFAQDYHAAFEIHDFFSPVVLDDKLKTQEMIDYYVHLKRDRSQDILHGYFFDVYVHSEDPLIAAVSEQRVRQCLDIGKSLGVKSCIFHTNINPMLKSKAYLENWINKSELFWKKMLREYDTLCIMLENMFDADPSQLLKLTERMKDENRFGICLDYAHTKCFGKNSNSWMMLLPFVKHVHINDNNFEEDQHLAVGADEGRINWEQFSEEMRNNRNDASVLIEVKFENIRESLTYLKTHKIYPY